MPADEVARGATRDATRAVGAGLRREGELLVARDAPVDVLEVVAAQLAAAEQAFAAAPERARRPDHDELGSLRGEANPLAPPLRFVPADPGTVAATARPGRLYEGPPGCVHGGWIAALFDEVLAVLQRDAGVNGMTAELAVRFRRPVPVGAELRFSGRIEDDASPPTGRSVTASATCTVDGEPAASAQARFVRGAMRDTTARPAR
jgi:acyl-coenzyme A thioesterase PaaI-like protein